MLSYLIGEKVKIRVPSSGEDGSDGLFHTLRRSVSNKTMLERSLASFDKPHAASPVTWQPPWVQSSDRWSHMCTGGTFPNTEAPA